MKKKFSKFLGVGLALMLVVSFSLVTAVPASAAVDGTLKITEDYVLDGGSITITVTDNDLNLNGGVAETIIARVVSVEEPTASVVDEGIAVGVGTHTTVKSVDPGTDNLFDPGDIIFDAGTSGVTVTDMSRNTDGTVLITFDGDTGDDTANIDYTAAETALLTETGPDTGVFSGSKTVNTVDAVGTLLVTDGSTITASYYDSLDGDRTGNNEDTAIADTVKPTVLITVTPDPTLTQDIGGLEFELVFSESMNTGVEPTVTYDPADGVGAQDCTGGSWSQTIDPNDTYTVYNDAAITDATGDGVAAISVSGASDLAGNVMDADIDDTFTIDTVEPAISDVAPASSSFVNDTKVSYTLSENVGSGSVTWTQTGGVADAGSPHVQALAGGELNVGAHTDITLTDDPTLVDGAIYSIAFDVTDVSGNVATTVTQTNVTYDTTLPAIDKVEGQVGSNSLEVTFSEGVYANSDATGALEPGDFALVDIDNSRTIHAVTHTAGSDTATLTLYDSTDTDPLPLDFTDDIGTDTLAAMATAIYDQAGTAADVATKTIGDTIAPPAPTTVEITTDPILFANVADVAVTVTFDTVPEPGNLQVQLFDVGEAHSTVIAETGDTIFTETPTVVEFTDIDCALLDDGTITAKAWLTDGGDTDSAFTTDTAYKDAVVPTLVSAETKTIITIDATFSEDLDGTTVDFNDFSVADNNVTGASLSAPTVVTLKLGTALGVDDEPDVTYTQGTLADLAGNLVPTATQGATDGIAAEEYATTFDISLAPDWNLISLPLIPDNPSISAVLGGISGGTVNKVWAYDARPSVPEIERWSFYVPAEGVGSLEEMSDGVGYWLEMSGVTTLTINGTTMPVGAAPPPAYDVYAGWNLIGFKSLSSVTPESKYLTTIDGSYTTIWAYQAGYFLIYSSGPGTFEMDPGFGYWIWMTADGTIVTYTQ